jgi:predicted type IV restriction endonuclease
MTETTRQKVAAALLRLRKRINQVRTRKESIGEQNTKATLIDPLLSALEWDLEELDEVSREYKRKPQDNPVDYALFILRSPRLFVEAKDLDKDLNDRKWISQTLGYATVVGVEWCVLTNGDEYRIYNAHAPVDVEEKLFRSIRISNPSQDEYILDTLDLLSKDKMGENLINVLWKAHFIDRHVKTAVEELFRDEDKRLINLIRKKTPELSPVEIRESLKRADIQLDFPMITVPRQLPGAKPLRKKIQLGVKVSDLIQTGLLNPPLELEQKYIGVRLKATVQQDGNIVSDHGVNDTPLQVGF